MAKKRVYELAKDRGLSSKDLLAKLQKAGIDVKAASSSVDEADVAKLFSGNSSDGAQPAAAPKKQAGGKPAAPSKPADTPKPAAQAKPAGGAKPDDVVEADYEIVDESKK